jgi:Na+-transporting NADH:ubiquinone oxidoreductase subunit C
MVVIVAFLLAFVSSSLKPIQDKNVELDKKKQILAALNIRNVEDVEAEYNKVVKADMVINANADTLKLGENKDQDGFKVENKDLSPENPPLYVCEVNGEVKYVVPMLGRGLWGGLWGYMAVNDDCKTIFGAYFSHESETAGLGSPIAEQPFQKRFKGMQLFAEGDSTNVALTIVKKGQVKSPKTEVDGLTGATLTTKGAAAMVTDGLQQYINFFNANAK